MTQTPETRGAGRSVRFAGDADLERIAEFNRTEAPFPRDASFHVLFEAQVARNGSGTAVTCDHDRAVGVPTLTYAQLNERANRLAHLLRGEGVGPGHIVALMTERSYAMIVGILGIMKAGAAYLPIGPDNPTARIDYLLADAEVQVLLVQTATVRDLTFAGKIVDLEALSTPGGPVENQPELVKPTDLAYVIYTSGSTGKPKGVMIEHRSLVNRLHWMQQAYAISGRDVILQKTPYYFDVSVWELLWALTQGASLCFLPPGGEKHPLAIVDTIRKHGISVMHFVPSMLNVFLEYLDGRPADVVKKKLGSVRRVFASGEALTATHVGRFNALWGSVTGARLTNLYGPTEATVDVSYYDCPTGGEIEKVPIGRPIQNVRFHMISDGREVAVGEIGELCIAGVGVGRGYLNNPHLTAEKFPDNPANPGERIYRTGDIARWLPDGNVEYLGREDDQVKIRGLRIELGEIESAIRGYPGVRDCAVTVRQYSETMVLIVAYVVPRVGMEIDTLKQYLKGQLPAYMVPNHIEEITEIPLTPTGKSDRKALPEPTIVARPA